MFRPFFNRYKALYALLSAAILTLLWSCASMGTPGGGLYDETPPVLVRSNPGEGATQVNKQKIVMRFNENIKLDNANDKLTISPPQEKSPTIMSNAKTVTIELQDTLKPDVTYTIDLGDAVQDNNEGNPMENLTLTFSTGDHIDTMKVLGTVLNAEDLEPVTGAFVGIYAVDEEGNYIKRGTPGDSLQTAIDSIIAIYPDSIFALRPFERAGKTDSYGRFTISGVAEGRYRIFALKDANTNYRYDTFDEDIAFLDSLILPSVGSHMASDTVWNRFDSTKVDTIRVHEVTDYYPNNLCLRLFNEGRVNRYLDDASRTDSLRISLRFAARQDSLPRITMIDADSLGPAGVNKDSWLICERNQTNDTLTYWIRDSLIYTRDTLSLSVTYPFTQNGIEISRTDTIHLEKPIVKSDDKNGKDDSKDKAKDKKKKKKPKKGDAAPEDSIKAPATVFMNLTLKEKTLEIGGRPHLEASAPLDTIDLSGFHLQVKKDTLWIPLNYRLDQDTMNLRLYTLHALPHFSPGQEYRITVDSASVRDIYGHPINHTTLTFNEKKPDEYAHLLLNIIGAEGPAFVQIVSEKDKLVQQMPVKGGQAKFVHIPAGKYYARLVEDRNDNGKFDVGSLDGRIQPEEVYYFSTLLELRVNWDFSQTWNIHALDPTAQKPKELIQNKPKEKTQRKSKNEEYLKEHPKSKAKAPVK